MDSSVNFLDISNPHANRLTLHLLSAVAEAEALAISQRTKAALAAYKARGGLLGASLPQCNKLTQEARKKGARMAGITVAKLAAEAYVDLRPTVIEMRARGQSLKAIADALNAQGHSTRRGKPFGPMQVLRVLEHSDNHNGKSE
jgi:DNA invertase Pin-like site-specific DNA recombinase